MGVDDVLDSRVVDVAMQIGYGGFSPYRPALAPRDEAPISHTVMPENQGHTGTIEFVNKRAFSPLCNYRDEDFIALDV